ncbi:hypothetical protein SAMN04487785_11423 [Dyella jiangningensis]|uniref:hypothetical protein n=1 Tax=Dyella sp. AtDHG13 TaxID=1938897 RepID=UPI0008831973|nr:hypothetical protein [Dyella sp. AtDHG13]PXV54197.1 hypothetical protein BDW41_113150 [Dyella sp. AtDHG13]SDL04423.1 hypothetical protein SAMN04487785_11423 [Dyella jiangningensis]
MNALPCYAERAAREYQRVQDQAENRAAAELDALEEMRGNRTEVSEYIQAPRTAENLDALVALFLGHGLPLRDKTRSDDALRDRYEHLHESMTAEFDAWARKSGRLARWMEVVL